MSTNDLPADAIRLTHWFDIDMHLPVHVGVYDVMVAAAAALSLSAQHGYCAWNGQRFGGVAQTPQEALARRNGSPGGRVTEWRGIEVGLRWIARPAPEVAVDKSNESTLAALNRIESRYARYDEAACREMLFRLETAARGGRMLTLEQFVRGITFTLPDDEGRILQKHTIDSDTITPKDESIIPDFAHYLGAATYRDSKILINALLTTRRAKPEPPTSFFEWAQTIGQYRGGNALDAAEFWQQAVKAVHARYA